MKSDTKQFPKNRRGFLKRCAALCTVGITTALHSPAVLASSISNSLNNIKGLIVRKTDKNYSLWWGSMSWYIFKPKRYPDLIIRASSEQDVTETINYAREQGVKIAVRSTGHNPARSTLRDGGILLDLSRMRDVDIDVENQTAWIQPGIKAEELLELTTEHGLAFPAAHTGIVGLGGYLLGGGLGWNMAEYGIACRSILAAEIVMANGKKIVVSANKNQDLHWAIRGVGPGFFGAVVRYKLQLYPIHQAIRVNKYVITLDKIEKAMATFKKIGDECDKRLEIFIKIGRFHPEEKSYSERELVCTVGFFAFGDSKEEAAKLLLPVTESDIAELSVVKNENIAVGYEQLYAPPETDYSSPNRTVVENMWTDDIDKSLLLLTEKMLAEPPKSPRSFLLGGWSFNSTFNDPGSSVETGGRHYLSWYMIAEEEEHIAPNYKWMDESLELVDPYVKSRYINEIDTKRYPHQIAECFSKEAWGRLAKLRKQYDPKGVFHTYLGHDGSGTA